MKILLITLIFLTGLLSPLSALAIDPGTATGVLKVGSAAVTLTHACAHLHDNAEGWLDFKKELRILVTDREVDQDVLAGLNPFFTLSTMVRQGSLRGVLLRFDPSNPKSVLATVLYPPAEQGMSLGNKTISDSAKSPLENLVVSDVRVSAAISQSSPDSAEQGWPAESYSFKFSAPLFREAAVTATLKGRQALDSPQAKAILARATALISGDLEKVRRYSSERFIRQIDNFLAKSPETAKSMMRESGEESEQAVRKGTLKLIVRGSRATLMVEAKDGNSMFGLTKKEGNWIVD